MRHKKVAVGFVLLGIIAMAVGLLALLELGPKVNIQCSRDHQGRLIVDLEPNWQVIEICGARFWCEGDDKFRWELKTHPGDPFSNHIVYGEIPGAFIQKYPADNVLPEQLPNVGVLYVAVDYIYDSYFPPESFSGGFAVKLQLTEDGGVKYLGDVLSGEGLISKP
jgi:hypothetical protein